MPATKKKARQEASGSATRRDDDDDDEDEAFAEEDEPLEDDEEDDGDEEDDAEATNDGETSGGGKGKRVATGKMKEAAAKLADKREDWTPAEDAIVEEFLRAQEAERVAKAGRKERGEPEPKPPSKKERGGQKLPKKGYARLAEMLKAEGFDRGDSAAQKRAKRLQKRFEAEQKQTRAEKTKPSESERGQPGGSGGSMSADNWTDEEVELLIDAFTELREPGEAYGVGADIWGRVSARLKEEHGISRTPKACRAKFARYWIDDQRRTYDLKYGEGEYDKSREEQKAARKRRRAEKDRREAEKKEAEAAAAQAAAAAAEAEAEAERQKAAEEAARRQRYEEANDELEPPPEGGFGIGGDDDEDDEDDDDGSGSDNDPNFDE